MKSQVKTGERERKHRERSILWHKSLEALRQINFLVLQKKEMERKPQVWVRETTLKTVFEMLQNLLKLFKGTTLPMSATVCSFISLGKKITCTQRAKMCSELKSHASRSRYNSAVVIC